MVESRWNRWKVALVVGLVGVILSGNPLARAGLRPGGKQWHFDGDAVGRVAAGFEAATGRWAVVEDPGASSGTHVLAQLAASADDVFNVALATGTSFKDVELTVRLRAVQGRVDQGGGVVWRAQDANNYYIARYNPLEDNFRVYKVVNGRRRMLEGSRVTVDHAAWHTLRVVMKGDHIECYLDGKKYLEARDDTFGVAGKVGLWTKADARTHFDDLAVVPVGMGETP